MAALRDEWQAARRLRQQTLAQRRADVQENLSQLQQTREQTAVALRQDLAEHYASVQDETTLFLTQVEQQRQAQAKQTAAMLQAFDAELRETVAAQRDQNRQALQAVAEQVTELRQATHEVLAGHTRDRAVMRSRQQQIRSEYLDALEATVADYLTEITEIRQTAAVADRAQRHRDREALTADVQAMRDDFMIYRQQMQAFREQLRESVWGDAVSTASAASTRPPAAAPASKPASRKASAQAKSAVPSSKSAAAKPAASNGHQPTKANAAAKAAPAKSAVPNEEAVFDFLQSHDDGARLTEIESTLGINRFQAVDALRSLIQKELIVQKDRTYRIQEEAVL